MTLQLKDPDAAAPAELHRRPVGRRRQPRHARRRSTPPRARRSAPCRRWARPRPGAPSKPRRARCPAWAKKTAKERAAILRRWYDLMLAHQDDLATIMTAEQGKPLAESKGEIALRRELHRVVRGRSASALYGDVIPGHQPDKRILVLRQPVGVVAAITPWNFPAAMITRKVAPALAAGCTFVCKPATQTPYSAFAMAELAARAGVPRGVLNILTGGSTEIGGEMTSNPIVRKLTFTGSTEVGKKLMAQMRGHAEEAVDGAGRQRAVHRVRRCGSRRRRRRRHRQQIPQHRPDLRVREPPPRAERRVRRVHAQAGRGRREAACRATA